MAKEGNGWVVSTPHQPQREPDARRHGRRFSDPRTTMPRLGRRRARSTASRTACSCWPNAQCIQDATASARRVPGSATARRAGVRQGRSSRCGRPGSMAARGFAEVVDAADRSLVASILHVTNILARRPRDSSRNHHERAAESLVLAALHVARSPPRRRQDEYHEKPSLCALRPRLDAGVFRGTLNEHAARPWPPSSQKRAAPAALADQCVQGRAERRPIAGLSPAAVNTR